VADKVVEEHAEDVVEDMGLIAVVREWKSEGKGAGQPRACSVTNSTYCSAKNSAYEISGT
jgi:hypothetical protein